MAISGWYKSGKELIEEMKGTQVPGGMLAIWYLGQAGIVVKAAEGTFVIDPYLGHPEPDVRRFAAPFAPEELDFLDAVLCTHNHSDHLDPYTLKGIAAVSPETKFIVPRPWTNVVEDIGVRAENILGAAVGEIIRMESRAANAPNRIVGATTEKSIHTDSAPAVEEMAASSGMVIHPVPAAHEELTKDENGDYENLGYVLAFGAASVYHAGDTVEWETMTEELRQYPIDVACLPINGSDWKRKRANIIGNLNSREAANVAEEIGADLMIPLHYDLFPHNGEDPGNLADYMFREHAGHKYHFMAPGERFWYSRSRVY